jgi:hypothetical protein
MRRSWHYQVMFTLFVTIALIDAASLSTPEDHAKNVDDVSRFQMMLRFFPQCSKKWRQNIP